MQTNLTQLPIEMTSLCVSFRVILFLLKPLKRERPFVNAIAFIRIKSDLVIEIMMLFYSISQHAVQLKRDNVEIKIIKKII